MTNFEKLGVFYLGRTVDTDSTSSEATPLLYDSQDLTTHAVCIGMTGSGKTGLGIGLIEEAAIDGIPSILIDPKGDLGNLLLTFPNLSPADFRPWVDEGEAARKQMTPDEFATHTAAVWKKGCLLYTSLPISRWTASSITPSRPSCAGRCIWAAWCASLSVGGARAAS